MRYFTDGSELLTEDYLRRVYDSDFDNSHEEFIKRGLSDGSFREISKGDMERVHVTTVYYDGHMEQHTDDIYMDYIYAIKQMTTNGNEVNWDAVNCIIIDEEEAKVIQASGYSNERGLFVDLY